MINLIVAVADNGVIGNGNALPWPRIDEDMAWFRKHTKGHAVVMGRKTWESLPDKPLPSRSNYVFTRNYGWFEDEARKYGKDIGLMGGGEDIANGIRHFGYLPDVTELFIIGGAEIYRQTLPIVDTIYLTNVYGEYEGDTFLSELGLALGDFSQTYEEEVPGKCKFEIWTRDNGPKI